MSSKLHGHFFRRVLTCANNTVPRCAKYLTWDFFCLWTKVLKDYDLQRGESTWELNTWDWNALCSNGQGLAEGSICVIKYEWKMVWCKAIHTRYIFGWSSFHVLIPSLLQAIYTRFDFVSLDQEVVKNRIESMTMLTNSNQFQHMLIEIFLLFWFETNSIIWERKQDQISDILQP